MAFQAFSLEGNVNHHKIIFDLNQSKFLFTYIYIHKTLTQKPTNPCVHTNTIILLYYITL